MYKSMLQELCQRCAWDQALYVTEKEGPDHGPRFTSKCTVRGICFESPKNESKSSKEAQNLAAKIAFEHLSALVAVPHPVTSPSPSSLPAPGFVFSSSKNLSVKPTEGEGLQQKTAQTSLPGGCQSPRVNENLPKGTPHLFKNQLQHLTQKKCLPLPVYTSESDGPSHAPRFRATVTVDGRPYKTTEFFSTLREAEHASARIAFESLSEGEIQEDDSLYKSLLQEFAQRNSIYLPTYNTEKIGPAHGPSFKCTVEVGSRTFCGVVCKTKKLAEMNAAKVAFNGLTQCKDTDTSADGKKKENSGIGSGNNISLQSTIGASNAMETRVQVACGETGTPHLFKNQLQHLAQTKCLPLPVYTSESDGPPHAPRFRASVTVDGRPYKTTEFFSTLREAEHASARIAFESLSEGEIQEDDSLYKSLLQEFAQRSSMHLPTYNTEKIGPAHGPSFKCTVEVGSRTFCGVVCKTKKLAEMNAAKVAFNGLTQCKDTDTSADGKKKENSGIGSGNNTSLQSTIGASNAMETRVQVACGETGETTKNNQLSSPAKGKNKAITVSPDNDGHVGGKEPGTKKLKYSTSPDDKHFLPEFPLMNAVLHSSAASDAGKAVGESGSKVVIYPRESNVTIPDGALILPCSNDKWVITRMEFNQGC